MIGLWQATGDRTGIESDEVTGAGFHGGKRSLLLTRRPNLAMWERSKLPEGKAEAKVRDMLSRRYDLCDWTVVSKDDESTPAVLIEGSGLATTREVWVDRRPAGGWQILSDRKLLIPITVEDADEVEIVVRTPDGDVITRVDTSDDTVVE